MLPRRGRQTGEGKKDKITPEGYSLYSIDLETLSFSACSIDLETFGQNALIIVGTMALQL
jgi:hypothetical protein